MGASEAVGLHTSYLTQMTPAFPKLKSNQVFSLSIILQLEDRFEHVMVNPKETVDAEIRRALALPENTSITATYAAAEVGELTFLDEGVEEGGRIVVRNPLCQKNPIEILNYVDELTEEHNAFVWNTTHQLDDLIYLDDGREAKKMNRLPDWSRCISSMPLEAGTWFWEVQLLQKGDEVW